MAQGPDSKKEDKNLFNLIDKLNQKLWAEGGLKRPKDWTDNPYIGKDGRDYPTWEALQEANRRWADLFFTSGKYPDKIISQNPLEQILEGKPEKR